MDFKSKRLSEADMDKNLDRALYAGQVILLIVKGFGKNLHKGLIGHGLLDLANPLFMLRDNLGCTSGVL